MFRYPTNFISITHYPHSKDDLSIDFGYDSHKYQDIYSIGNGKVIRVETQITGGNCIFIKHDNGMVSLYGHLNNFNVKYNDKVSLGQKIGNMGESGQVTGQHLHLGVYSKEKADIGFNSKGLYGNADINPFEVLEVYQNQQVNEKTLKEYGSMIKYHEDLKIGKYKIIYKDGKAIRTDHKLGVEYIVLVKDVMYDPYKKYNMLTSTNDYDKAYIAVNQIVDITEIYVDETSRVWGKLKNCWIVLVNKDGTPQAERL